MSETNKREPSAPMTREEVLAKWRREGLHAAVALVESLPVAPLPPSVAAGERTTDCLVGRGDVGMGYWTARALLARTFPTHPALNYVGKDELREALSACADAFAVFVLAHPPAAASSPGGDALREAVEGLRRIDAFLARLCCEAAEHEDRESLIKAGALRADVERIDAALAKGGAP